MPKLFTVELTADEIILLMRLTEAFGVLTENNEEFRKDERFSMNIGRVLDKMRTAAPEVTECLEEKNVRDYLKQGKGW
jgi:hypothetical protein